MATTIEISPQAQALLQRLKRFPMAEICRALDYQNELTVGHIQQDYLSLRGPKTLGVVTNRLRSSIRPSKAAVVGMEIVSSIGSNVKYAGIHEFGFQGKVQVAPFTRKVATRNVYRRGGRDYTRSGDRATWETLRKTLKPSAQGYCYVKAHARQMNVPARAPIQNGIKDRVPQYTQAISTAIISALSGATPQ